MKIVAITLLLLCAAPDGGVPTQAQQQYFDEAAALKKQKNFERAKVKLEKCIKLKPEFPACFRLLASVHASIATRDKSRPEMEKARKYYERFTELEPEGPYSPPMGDWGGLELPPPRPIP
jgi:tetratricopeptide (TPR) repeat protein